MVHRKAWGGFLSALYKRLVSVIERSCLLRLKSSTVFSGVGQPVCLELGEIGIEKNGSVTFQTGLILPDITPQKIKIVFEIGWGFRLMIWYC